MRLRKDDLGLDPAFPFWIGVVELGYDPEMPETRHWHDCLEITSVREGRADYFVEGETYGMARGDLIVFNEVEPHGWVVREGETMSALVATFSPSLVAEGASLFDYEYLRPFRERGSNFRNRLAAGDEGASRLVALLEEARAEFEAGEPGYRLMIKAIVLQLLTLLQRCYSRGQQRDEALESRRAALERVAGALDLIQERFREDISLDDAAREAGMSPHYFSSYFKRATGSSFIEQLTRLRVCKARELARSTDRTLVDIAMECGFNNMANFYRAYRRVFGAPPGDERRRGRA
jgi:AraC-like DNA-binding protein/quercetin dioxygenase-like cupin family protein